MPYLISTYRPFEWLKPISWVNSGTRQKQRYPVDHVAYYCNGYIYESVVGKGVRSISYNDWIKTRQGTTLTLFQVDASQFDLNVFDRLEGTKYDIPANLFNLFGLFKLLRYKADKRIQCAELIANMMHLDKPEIFTPRMIVDIMIKERRTQNIKVI